MLLIVSLIILIKLLSNKDCDLENQKNESFKNDIYRQLDVFKNSISESQGTLQKTVSDMFRSFDERFANSQNSNEKKIEAIRDTVDIRLKELQKDNNEKLDKMRETVDEKLQKTLESRITESFKIVSERLEQVHKSLGEMQNLATGVGDLKKVLSNVKTRGILGEIQLGAILEDMLAPDQYVKNIATKKGSSNFVEYAVKLPGDENGCVYLPIDAKFPSDAYSNLMDAYDKGNIDEINECGKILDVRIKAFAKDIKEKYIYPPDTTDFGIMFLPTEGLYSEVVKRGMFEKIQREYSIVIAGPTTMAALLNSLQMGFKTLAIQKRSSEVWTVLQAVRTEFDKFGTVLQTAQTKILSASDEIDKLVGTRTRQIQRKLKDVSELSDVEAREILEEYDE